MMGIEVESMSMVICVCIISVVQLIGILRR